MKKSNIFSLLTIGATMLLTSACSKEDIVFDHELPMFETREGAYLLEVIVPYGTGANDEIYISGVFNGNDDETVSQDPRWRLEKSETSNLKWGIYLFPEDFIEGTTLADGYHFFSAKQGEERTNDNTPANHVEMPALGGRCNVWVEQWASFFDGVPEIEHDGYVIYVEDKTTWGSLYCYIWGTTEVFGGWPGATPTGTETINGVRYKYFDTGKDNMGNAINIIFHNNSDDGTDRRYEGGILSGLTLDHNYFFRITDVSIENLEVEPEVEHDGYAIFVIDRTGWDDIACYAWNKDLPNLFGDWPGVAPTGTQKINGMVYKYFDTGADNVGLYYNFIFNNNNSSNNKQIENNDVLGKTLDRDYYFWLKDDLTVEEVDPANLPEGIPAEGDQPDQPQKNTYKVYVNTDLPWDDFAMYAWGDEEVFGTWPGQVCTETKTINSAEYKVFTYQAVPGATLHLILNNNLTDDNKIQMDNAAAIVADRDYYFVVTPESEEWEEVDPAGTYKIYVDASATGWAEVAVYAWGEQPLPELFGGWPGEQMTQTETIDGVTYNVVEYRGMDDNYNLIFNDNGKGTQTEGNYPIVTNADYYLKIVKNADDKFVVQSAK